LRKLGILEECQCCVGGGLGSMAAGCQGQSGRWPLSLGSMSW
jgi:hypothetical protein